MTERITIVLHCIAVFSRSERLALPIFRSPCRRRLPHSEISGGCKTLLEEGTVTFVGFEPFGHIYCNCLPWDATALRVRSGARQGRACQVVAATGPDIENLRSYYGE